MLEIILAVLALVREGVRDLRLIQRLHQRVDLVGPHRQANHRAEFEHGAHQNGAQPLSYRVSQESPSGRRRTANALSCWGRD